MIRNSHDIYFNDRTSWSKVLFKEIAERVSQSGESGEVPYIEFEDIISGEGKLNKDIYQRNIKKVGKKFNPDDVLFGKLRPYLRNIFFANTSGIAVGDFWVLRPVGIEPYLLFLLVNSQAFMEVANISSGSKMPRADWKLVSNMEIVIPESRQDQQSISNFFKLVDSYMAGVSNKLASLKQIKSACLQAMFPQEGESVPKVRFKGFNEEWNKVEFGSLIDECLEKSKTENEDILLSSAINGLFLNSELFGHQRGKSNIGYRKIKKNMLILSAQNLHLGNANVNLRFEHGLVSPAYKIYYLRNVNPLFMHQWIKRDSTKTFFLNATTAGASLCRKNIVWEDLYKQTLLAPSMEEQEHIGRFFINLDYQITLQTQRLEKLKQIKIACLDKMFV